LRNSKESGPFAPREEGRNALPAKLTTSKPMDERSTEGRSGVPPLSWHCPYQPLCAMHLLTEPRLNAKATDLLPIPVLDSDAFGLLVATLKRRDAASTIITHFAGLHPRNSGFPALLARSERATDFVASRPFTRCKCGAIRASCFAQATKGDDPDGD
jgi:hypothetical protein